CAGWCSRRSETSWPRRSWPAGCATGPPCASTWRTRKTGCRSRRSDPDRDRSPLARLLAREDSAGMSRIRVKNGKAEKGRKTPSAGELGLVVALLAAGTFAARLMGYKLGRETIVRCRAGHLYTTIWIPGASLK